MTERRRDRFAWVGDEVLHLRIDGARVKSADIVERDIKPDKPPPEPKR